VLKEQEDGILIIACRDESYMYAHHCSDTLSRQPPRMRCMATAGARIIIIIHAMSKHGLLEVEGTECRTSISSCTTAARSSPTRCAWGVFPAYNHDTIHGDMFIG